MDTEWLRIDANIELPEEGSEDWIALLPGWTSDWLDRIRSEKTEQFVQSCLQMAALAQSRTDEKVWLDRALASHPTSESAVIAMLQHLFETRHDNDAAELFANYSKTISQQFQRLPSPRVLRAMRGTETQLKQRHVAGLSSSENLKLAIANAPLSLHSGDLKTGIFRLERALKEESVPKHLAKSAMVWLIRLHNGLGQFQQVLACLERLRELQGDEPDTAEILIARAYGCIVVSDIEALYEATQTVQKLFQPYEIELMAESYSLELYAHYYLDNTTAGIEAAQKGIDLVFGGLAPYWEVTLQMGQCSCLVKAGRHSSVLPKIERVISTAEEYGFTARQAHALTVKGKALEMMKQFEEALECFITAVRLTKTLELPGLHAMAQTYLAEAYSALGEFEQVIEIQQEVLIDRKIRGERKGYATSLDSLGMAQISAKRYEEAAQTFQLAVTEHLSLHELPLVTFSRFGLAEAYLGMSAPDLASQELRTAVKEYQGHSSNPDVINYVLADRGPAYHADLAKRIKEARRRLKQAL